LKFRKQLLYHQQSKNKSSNRNNKLCKRFFACKIEFHLQENFLLCVVLFCDLALTLRFTHQSSYNQETNLTIARAQRGFPTPLPHNHQWSEETKIIIQNSQSPVKVRTVRTFGLIAWIRKLLSWTQLFA